ncbi:transcriptional regulator, LysR family [Rhizobiales bacterium GAS188]|nr:transcriptional regulator, LysR family [Rhizobiales bacterium GAS188]
MRKPGFAEMTAFVAIAERSSFAKAAIHLGISRSALSETIRILEDKLGVRLLNRTTRSVALTEVGERLLAALRPALDGFEAAVESINMFRDKPAGHLRLTVPRPAARVVLAPVLAKFLAAYPAITLEIVTDSALTDIVRNRFDAGIRPGHRVERDMIAVRVGEDARPTIVASPGYLLRHPRPKVPGDLQAHNCIRQRFASGVIPQWAFEKRGKSLEVMVEGSLIVSDGDIAARAAVDGAGIARLPLSSVEDLVRQARLIPLLQDWAPRSVGFFLYYPSRRQTPAALQVLVDFLKAQARHDGGPQTA